MSLPLRAEVQEAFTAALELPPAEREAYLARRFPGEPQLRTEALSLLSAYEAAGSFLEPGPPVALPTLEGGDQHAQPDAIGQYRIIRLVGEGAMGAVYEAEQQQPRRTVALKVIKPGLTSPEMLRRFAQESQALGRLQHQGIAQIYEAGSAQGDSGLQPYFAMEFIRGESLLAYAETHQLNTKQRLELMARICEAVYHAHQRGIIHRDLKPGNILVDEAGQPKILDFGLARVTDSDVQASRQTDAGRLVGTLAYMSPEQVLADPLELDTRSDVYALGVILFELLTGSLPYKVGRQPHEALRAIREDDPTRLGSFSSTYRGDIETIVAKALEKEKGRRYSSAADLAADLRRYLNDEPIAARRPSASYHLRKFARRHMALVSAVAAMFIVLIAGITISTLEAVRARRAEATAAAINDFLENDLLAQASPYEQAGRHTKPDPDLKVRTVLDRAATRIGHRFDGQPLVEASLRKTIASAYLDLGVYTDAEIHMKRALDLQLRLQGEQNRDTLETMNNLVALYHAQGKYEPAESLGVRVLELRRRLLGEEHPQTLRSMNNLSVLYQEQSKYVQAGALAAKVLDVRRRTLGENHADTLSSMNNLGMLYFDQAKYDEAEPLFIEVLQKKQRTLGETHPSTLIAANNLGMLYLRQGKSAEAEPLFTNLLEVRRRVMGNDHPDTLISMNNLGALYLDQGKYAESEQVFSEVLEARRRVLGESHPDTMRSTKNLAIAYRNQKMYAEAEPLFTHAMQLQQRLLGEDNRDTQDTTYQLAFMLWVEGRYSELEPLVTKLLETRRRVYGPEHPETGSVTTLLAHLRIGQRRYSEAESLLRQALKAQEKRPKGWQLLDAKAALGSSLAGQLRFADAEPLLLNGCTGLLQRPSTIPWEGRQTLLQSCETIVRLYQDWGKPQAAADWREKLRQF